MCLGVVCLDGSEVRFDIHGRMVLASRSVCALSTAEPVSRTFTVQVVFVVPVLCAGGSALSSRVAGVKWRRTAAGSGWGMAAGWLCMHGNHKGRTCALLCIHVQGRGVRVCLVVCSCEHGMRSGPAVITEWLLFLFLVCFGFMLHQRDILPARCACGMLC